METKTVKPDKYELKQGYEDLGQHDHLTASIVSRVKGDRRYFDIVVNVNGRLFVVKPWSIYSQKSVNVYNWYLRDLALTKLAPTNEPASSIKSK